MADNDQGAKYGTKWEREESILALYLYCQIPFAKTKANNPEVIRLAKLIERTPSAVARKLGNFGAFDSLLQSRGVTGLTHGSYDDEAIWNEFHGHWESLVAVVDGILAGLPATMQENEARQEVTLEEEFQRTERPVTRMERLCQSFFRKTILASYDNTCCICGMDLTRLLVASHIVPWAAREETRTDPGNGLCLCAIHDKAFDRGLLGVLETNEIVISKAVSVSKSTAAHEYLKAFAGQSIHLPRRFPPNPANLTWHLENIFRQ